MNRYHLYLLIGFVYLLSACSGNPATTPDPVDKNSADAAETPSSTGKIIAPEAGEKLLFGDGRSVLLKATAEDSGARKLLLGTETLPNGTNIPVHSHDDYEEIIFVHQGTASLTLGDQTVRAAPGTTMYIPPGAWHGVASADPKQTTILFVFPEVKIADFFRFVGHREGEKPKNLTGDDWGKIMKKHRMRSRSD